MPRIPVPEDYGKGHISVAGSKDYHYGQADVNTDAVDHARDIRVSEDDGGRYVGCSSHYAADVAAFLGVEYETGTGDEPETSPADEEIPEESSDADPESVTDAIKAGECPWCEDYEGDGVPQHAGSAHPEEWQSYKEATE